MSSAVVPTSAALGRPFLFDAESEADVRLGTDKKPSAGQQSVAAQVLQSTIKNQQSTIPYVTPASQLGIRPLPEMVPSGIAEFDALTGGLPRGSLTEICGSASSGRTSVMLAALAAATRRGEYCALIDASDALDPHSVAAAGVDLDRLLWVRCNENPPRRHRDTEKTSGGKNLRNREHSEHRLEQVLRATDLLLESGGFGLIVLDLGDIPPQAARRIPMTTWFRFRRSVEHKPTVLLAIEQQPIAGSCSSLLLQLGATSSQLSVLSSDLSSPSHAQLFTELKIKVDLIRSRLDRKPARSVRFAAKTAWVG
ncbi:MAG TPA: hypothetical protein VGS27_24180 [Candidatus Sulfotelmatobacter sp.]|nr:hypothetical protein [Candidatus Sulfotelmatobacter sp.]